MAVLSETLRPKTIDTLPAARFRIIPGMKKGDMRRGPRSSRSRWVRSSRPKPPIPEPM